MNQQQLRVEALRAAVAIEQHLPDTSHRHTFDFAELYLEFLLTGKTPGHARPMTSADLPTQENL